MIGLCVGWAIAATCEALVLSPAVMKVFRGAPNTGSDHDESSS